MKSQSLASRLTYSRPIPLERIVHQIADRAQTSTQVYGKRPYGVGLLVAGVDETGTHLWEFQPSGQVQEMRAAAIGARSQMARTYLEREMAAFEDAGREELVRHGVRALKETLGGDKELTVENASIGVTGYRVEGGKRKMENFKLYDGAEVGPLLEKALEGTETKAEETREGGESMEVDT